MKPNAIRFLALLLSLVAICLKADDGSVDTSFNPSIYGAGVGGTSSSWIHAVIVQPDGKIIIGGSFSSVNGITRNQIARLNSDGSLDLTFNPIGGANHWVMSMAFQPDGKILIGGEFTGVNGISLNHIARLNSDGSVDTSFNPGSGANDLIWSVALQLDGKILIGGEFTSVNGNSAGRIARLNSDGSFDSTFNPQSGTDARVWSVASQPDGKVIIGGDFTQIGINLRNRIARLNADGSLDAGFKIGSGTDSSVVCVSLQNNGEILIGGPFGVVNGVPCNQIARLNGDGNVDVSFHPGATVTSPPNGSPIAMMQQSDGKILVGGGNLLRLNSDGSMDTNFNLGTGANSVLYSIAIQPDQKIIIGGNFTSFNGQTYNYITRLYGLDAQANLDNGLLAYYPFNGSATDASGNGHNGVNMGGQLCSDRFGNPANACLFNGTNYIMVSDFAAIDLSAGFTFSAWVSPYSFDFAPATTRAVISQPRSIDGTGYRLGFIKDNADVGMMASWFYPLDATETQREQSYAWIHIVATMNSSNVLLYVNGTYRAAITQNGWPYYHGAFPLYIGTEGIINAGDRFFRGAIDDVRIYNRALSDSEIRSLYAFENSNPRSVINGNIQTSSTLTVTPASAPANGQSNVTATVTLLNGVNNPVAGKTVRFISSRSITDNIKQPTSPTDANGRATATITTTTPGTTTISLTDQSDQLVVSQQRQVTFTSGSVPPGNDLSNAIVQLATGTSNLLCHSVASIAIDEGGYGDYFQGQATSGNAQKGIIALNTAAGGLLALIPGEKTFRGLIDDIAQSLIIDRSFDVLGDALDIIAGNSTGLTMFGQAIANNNSIIQPSIQQSEQSLLAGVPPASLNLTPDYINDLQLRLQANNALDLILLSQHNFLLNAKLSSQNAQNSYDLLSPLFAEADIIGDVVGVCLTGPGVVGVAEGLNAGESLIAAAINQNNLSANQQSYLTAITSLMNCSAYSSLIYSNTASAFNAIAIGKIPNPVTGKILNVTSEFTGPQYNLSGKWTGADPVTTPAVTGNKVTGGFSIVTLTNTSHQSATFSVYAIYQHTISLDLLGFSVASMQSSIVISATTNLTAGQTAQLQMTYFDGVHGALPDADNPILIYVLGYNGQNTQDIFNVGFVRAC